MKKINLLKGNCLEQLKQLPDNSIDSIVTDPPYGLSFMGKQWDYDVPTTEIWSECFRVLKPGGHLLAFFGTRTYHRGVVRIEDAGFEIRDQIQWIYGSGFPKSHNIKEGDFKGWGTALKPANEPVVVARKPLEKGLTVAENVLRHGTGAINVDAGRISMTDEDRAAVQAKANKKDTTNNIIEGFGNNTATHGDWSMSKGRWPANVLFDEDAAAVLDDQSGFLKSGARKVSVKKDTGVTFQAGGVSPCESSQGGASRFFYVAKASKRERNEGLEGMPQISLPKNGAEKRITVGGSKDIALPRANHHPTVKPIKLMEYLIKLVTPPNGTVLDPFMGSGSTGVAAKKLGFNFVGCELNSEYFEIAEKRIENAQV